MRESTAAVFSVLAFLAMLLTSCGDGGSIAENRTNRGYNPGVGPFDSRGNYVERWANDKSKGRWWRSSIASGPSDDTPPPTPPVIAANTSPTPKPAVRPVGPRPTPPVGSATPPTPKPKPVVKAKPKRKPPVRHTIKKGDTLWAISRKYKTSVTAIQRANGLKGTNLKIGRRLLIPRY